ncbi:MAG: hypothetical protein HRT88_02500 [Lentisphaeraceae bacterium]|nr:hypothetical protein [Lentisphaeraceae bacterium]
MKKNDDRMWSAYLDEELSITELENFESGLSEAELEHLKNEKEFEKEVSTVLKDDIKCPDALWQSVCEQVEEEENNNSSKKSKVWLFSTFAVAAAIVFIFLRPVVHYELQPQSLAQLKASRLIENDLTKVNSFLTRNAVPFKLHEFNDKMHHNISLIGATEEEISGEKVTTLLFNCCGDPVKVYILPKNSKAEQYISKENSSWKSGMTTAMVNDYRLAVVSQHSSPELLEFIRPI